jgi:hypothetical protein
MPLSAVRFGQFYDINGTAQQNDEVLALLKDQAKAKGIPLAADTHQKSGFIRIYTEDDFELGQPLETYTEDKAAFKAGLAAFKEELSRRGSALKEQNQQAVMSKYKNALVEAAAGNDPNLLFTTAQQMIAEYEEDCRAIDEKLVREESVFKYNNDPVEAFHRAANVISDRLGWREMPPRLQAVKVLKWLQAGRFDVANGQKLSWWAVRKQH